MKKYTFNNVVEEFKKTKYILLSTEDEYVNCGTNNMRYLCPDHMDKGEMTISLSHLMNGRGCYYCGRKRTEDAHKIEFNKEEDRKLCESRNFQYIDTIRKDGKIRIKFICNNHIELGEQLMVRDNMKRKINGCQYCCSKNLPHWYIEKKLDEINPFVSIIGNYNNITDRVDVYCEKHQYKYNSTVQNLLKGHGCYYCGLDKLSIFQFNTIEDVDSKVKNKNPHIDVVEYNGATSPVKCFCNIHNKFFKRTLYNLINSYSGCDECYTENIRKRQCLGIDEFKNRLNQKFPKIDVIGKYINNNTPIDLYCREHDYYFSITPSSMLSRHSCCPKSRKTYKEEYMCSILEKWGYNIQRQKTFDDCIDKKLLSFDAYLTDYNVLLEYQGEQHYKKIKFGKYSDEEMEWRYKYTQKHDQMKRDYCIKNNISLIEVPYWEFNNIENFLFDELSKLNIIEEKIS